MIRILGVRVDQINMEQSIAAIDYLIAAFRQEESFANQVVTINPEGIWLAKNDRDFWRIIEDAAIVTPDGNGILWAAKKQGDILEHRVTGIDLMDQLCRHAADSAWSIYLLGAKDDIAMRAADKLKNKYPKLNIVGIENGFFQDREEEIIEDIAAKKPDILFTALGMPIQEKWLAKHKSQLNCGVMIGVGGCFDVLAGEITRAPKWLRKLRLEWLWRLFKDPKRWRRYLIIPKYMRAVNKNKNNAG